MSIHKRILEQLKDGLVLGPTFPLRHISGFLGRKYHVTTINGAGTIHIRPKSSDALTFVQIFRNKQYDLSGFGQFPHVMAVYQSIINAGQIPIIIDAGANVGAAAIWFSRQFPQARILAVEPDADNAEVCRLNTRDLPNVKVIEAAIGSEHGRVSLKNPEKPGYYPANWAVQTVRNEDGKIAVCTIPEIILAVQQPANIFLVKIDIEGFEDDLFVRNTGWVDDAKVIIIEPHDWLFPGKGTSRNFQKAMADLRFEILISGENIIYVKLPTQT